MDFRECKDLKEVRQGSKGKSRVSRGSEGWVLPSIQPRPCGSADTSAFGTMTHQSQERGGTPVTVTGLCVPGKRHFPQKMSPGELCPRRQGEMLRMTAPEARGVPLSVTSGVSRSVHKRLTVHIPEDLGTHSFIHLWSSVV